jgi:hypothetical protein
MLLGSLFSNGTRGDASSLFCPLCDHPIPWGSSCNQCFAPAEVVDSIVSRRSPPRFVGVVGPSGVGKTVYLGMLLDLLSHGAAGLTGVARGSFSLSLQRNLMLALERQRFPDKTPSEPDRWHWVHAEVSVGQRRALCDIVTPDVAGEAVMQEIERPGTYPTILALIARCSALVVLADVQKVAAEGQAQELFAIQLITYLDSLRATSGARLKMPVAIVFTKSDLCDQPIADVNTFARSNVPALWRLCESRLKHYRFFCSGVAGSTARIVDSSFTESLVPLRIEPRGIIEPFAWLISELR